MKRIVLLMLCLVGCGHDNIRLIPVDSEETPEPGFYWDSEPSDGPIAESSVLQLDEEPQAEPPSPDAGEPPEFEPDAGVKGPQCDRPSRGQGHAYGVHKKCDR